MTASIASDFRICPDCRTRNDINSGRCIDCHCTLPPLAGQTLRRCPFCNVDLSSGQIFCRNCRKEQPTYW